MIIIKIGGGESINIEGIASDVAEINDQVIVVHGANYYRDQLLKKLGIQKEILTSVSGFSSVNSTPEILEIMMMTYSGLRNKQIVEIFQQKGINAIGLSGIDGALIRGKRNKGIRVIENGKKKIKRDLSGKPQSINIELLNMLIETGYTPIITMPIIDENGNAINSENDDVVGILARNLHPKTVHMLIEEVGFLSNTGEKIDTISSKQLDELVLKSEGRIQRKLHAISQMITENKSRIIISDGRRNNPILNSHEGTLFEF